MLFPGPILMTGLATMALDNQTHIRLVQFVLHRRQSRARPAAVRYPTATPRTACPASPVQ
jgi:hypothetical protein